MTHIPSQHPPRRAGGTVQTAVDAEPRTLLLREPTEGTNPNMYAFYGTLMSSDYYPGGVSFVSGESLGTSHGECQFRGDMYGVGYAYPAVLPGTGTVHGELWEARPEYAALARQRLDQIESYWPDMESRSMYLRRRVRMLEPDVEAWVYIWNGSMRALQPIPDGRWSRVDRLAYAPLDADYMTPGEVESVEATADDEQVA